jgi:Tol biopolymer transport system component/DNA-binding winged helix-turn-helix (wHTH) protein
MKTQEIFEFGPYRLQPVERLLLRNGEPIALTAKVFDLLVVLVENPGTLLEREKLLKTLWPDSFIEENNVTVNVSTLRKVLSEGGGQVQYIETVPKRGYRFVAEVRHESTAEAVLPEPPSAVVVSPTNSRLGIRPIYAIGITAFLLTALGVAGLLRFSGAEPPPVLDALPLTSYPGSEYSPTISPDGTRVAFTWQAPNGAVPGIYVKVIGAGDAIRLTGANEATTDPAWSPDGTQLAAIREIPGATDEPAPEIVVMPAVGGTARKVAEFHPFREVHGGLLTWSSDGKWLLVSSREPADAPLSITAISVENGQRRAITSPPRTYLGDGHPSLSPDGRSLVFSRNVTSIVGDYYLLEISPSDLSTRGEPKRLTFFENQTGGASWMPNGREIVFSAGPPLGGSRLFLLPVKRTAKAGELQPIPYIGIDGRAPVISRPNGRTPSRLVYEKISQQYSLWRRDLSSGKPAGATSWAPSTRMDQSPDISPDGKRVTFASTRSGNWEIWTCEVSGLNCAQLTSFGRSFSRCPRWSPDGTQIVFDSRVAGNADIFVIGAGGGKARQLTTETSNDILPSWSADGRFIYFSSNRTGESKIWRIPSAGGSASLVSERIGEGPQQSRDGKWVYFVKRTPQEPGIWRVPSAGGPEEKVAPEVNFGLSYTVAKSGPYYIAGSADTKRLMHYSFLSAKNSELFTDEQLDSNGLALAPDESWLLYVQAVQANVDLMFVDNFR